NTLDEVSLQLPQGLATTAPAVHVPASNEIVWRVVAGKNGRYDIDIGVSGQSFSKNIVVSSGVERLSPVRLRGRFWERLFVSAEPAMPESSPLESIAVNYGGRSIHFAWLDWNWIWLFFVLSLVACFLFEDIFVIER